MYKKNTGVTGFVIGKFLNATTGVEVTTGTPTCKRMLDGVGGTCANAASYDATSGLWKIALTAADMNADLIGLAFTLTNCLPIAYAIKTVTKLPSELNNAPALTDYQQRGVAVTLPAIAFPDDFTATQKEALHSQAILARNIYEQYPQGVHVVGSGVGLAWNGASYDGYWRLMDVSWNDPNSHTPTYYHEASQACLGYQSSPSAWIISDPEEIENKWQCNMIDGTYTPSPGKTCTGTFTVTKVFQTDTVNGIESRLNGSTAIAAASLINVGLWMPNDFTQTQKNFLAANNEIEIETEISVEAGFVLDGNSSAAGSYDLQTIQDDYSEYGGHQIYKKPDSNWYAFAHEDKWAFSQVFPPTQDEGGIPPFISESSLTASPAGPNGRIVDILYPEMLIGTAAPSGTMAMHPSTVTKSVAEIADMARQRLDGTLAIDVGSFAEMPAKGLTVGQAAQLTAIQAKTDTIIAGKFTIRSPLSLDGKTLTLIVGDDYSHLHGRAIDFISPNYPDLSGATCDLRILPRNATTPIMSVRGSVVDAQTIRYEPTHANTALLHAATAGEFVFSSRVTFGDGTIATENLGTCLIYSA